MLHLAEISEALERRRKEICQLTLRLAEASVAEKGTEPRNKTVPYGDDASPTGKAGSFYVHNWRRGRYPKGAGILDADEMMIGLSVMQSTLVAEPLRKWLETYPKERFQFILMDWPQEDPTRPVRGATDFLELPDLPLVMPDKVVNAGLPLEWCGDMLTVSGNPSNPKGIARPMFPIEELELLHARLQPDIEALEELTD